MNDTSIIHLLEHNGAIFTTMLSGISPEMFTWKPAPEKWCLLEILCHLYDEEIYDFKPRIKHVLQNPDNPMPAIDPVKWVTEHKYMEQDYQRILNLFIEERSNSIKWLQTIKDPAWHSYYVHPKFGNMSAFMLLTNWLAHDYLHIRQITSLKYHYLQLQTRESLSYAGSW
jgi:hypothetical protein